jgi:hypothetical protein
LGNIYNLLLDVGKLVWKSVLQTALILVTLFVIPKINIFSLISSILIWIYLFDLVFGEPSIKGWGYKALWTISFVSIFYFASLYLGKFGMIGAVLLLFFLAGWKIYVGWELFNKVTTWGAERVMDKHKEEFKIDERDYQKGIAGTNGWNNNEREEGRGIEEPKPIIKISNPLPETLQDLPTQSEDPSLTWDSDVKRKPLPSMQTKIRKRTRKIKLNSQELKVKN